MTEIKIDDGRGQRKDNLRGVAVESSGGVPPAWPVLVAHLPRQGRILDYGSWQGLAALWLRARGEVQVSFAHHSSVRLAQARDNAKASNLELPVQAMFPLEGNWDGIVLAAPEQRTALEMLAAQASAVLTSKGQLYVLARFPWREELEQYFRRVSILGTGEDWTLLQCSLPYGGNRPLPWRSLQVRVGEIEFQLASLPGNFSADALDPGTGAMLAEAKIPRGGRVLDLACGYGVVGIAAAKLGAAEVVYVDDDLAALTACRRNLEGLGLKGELVHSHLPAAVPGKFDSILTNPPYHTDYGVARSFLEFAARRLQAGGWLYVVVKKPAWYKKKLATLFGGCRTVERDGYTILSAQLRGKTSTAPSRAKTTRKHRQREQAARERGRKKRGEYKKISPNIGE